LFSRFSRKNQESFGYLTHSDGKASDGEEYPPAYLKSTVELYVALKEGDENPDKDDSVSSKNHQVQNNVIGNPAPRKSSKERQSSWRSCYYTRYVQ
jgi:hypothetical protein